MTLRYGIFTLAPALMLAFISAWALPVNGWLAWLIAVNLVTLCTYGYDKTIAGSGMMRVPETVLLALGFLGGTPGGLVGMALFHHKTAKREFQVKFWMVSAAQAALVILWVLFIKQ